MRMHRVSVMAQPGLEHFLARGPGMRDEVGMFFRRLCGFADRLDHEGMRGHAQFRSRRSCALLDVVRQFEGSRCHGSHPVKQLKVTPWYYLLPASSSKQVLLEFLKCRQVSLLATESRYQCAGRAEVLERVEREDLDILDVFDAGVALLFQQALQYAPRLLAIAGEVVVLHDQVGALCAGERRLLEGDVADQVEGGVILADFLDQRLQQHAVFLHFLENGDLALGRSTAAQEFVQGGVIAAHRRIAYQLT